MIFKRGAGSHPNIVIRVGADLELTNSGANVSLIRRHRKKAVC